ncbi:MAG: CdaR family protein [Candidatus Binatia bacterium]|nr:CdaR family protein [Candidatus Binatia bacterium]
MARFLEALRRAVTAIWDPRRWWQALTHNLLLKILSLAIAFGLWSFVNFGERDTVETVKVALELRNLPPNLMITSPRPDFVEVQLIGPRTLLGRIDRNRLALPIDLNGVRPGPAVFRLSPEALVLPRGVRVQRITPAQVTLELERVGHKIVPVRLRLHGRLRPEFQMAETKIAPEMVEVIGPASTIEDVTVAYTQPIDISNVEPGIFEREVALEPVGDYVSFSATRVVVQLRVEDVITTRELRRVPIEVRNARSSAAVTPGTVRVLLRGPKRLLQEAGIEERLAYVDASGKSPGRHRLAVVYDPPAGAEVVSIEPPDVLVNLAASHEQPRGRR